MPKRTTPPIPRTTRSRPLQQRQERRQGRAADDQRPERAEGVVEPGDEVVAPDAGVGRVVGDAEVGPADLQALRVRQGDRPQVLDLRQRVAGDDQVAQVPEAAAERAPARTTSPRPPSAAPPAPGRPPRRLSAAAIASTVTLVPAARPTASPATASGQPTGNARALLQLRVASRTASTRPGLSRPRVPRR